MTGQGARKALPPVERERSIPEYPGYKNVSPSIKWERINHKFSAGHDHFGRATHGIYHVRGTYRGNDHGGPWGVTYVKSPGSPQISVHSSKNRGFSVEPAPKLLTHHNYNQVFTHSDEKSALAAAEAHHHHITMPAALRSDKPERFHGLELKSFQRAIDALKAWEAGAQDSETLGYAADSPPELRQRRNKQVRGEYNEPMDETISGREKVQKSSWLTTALGVLEKGRSCPKCGEKDCVHMRKANDTLNMEPRATRVPTPPKSTPEPGQQREQFSGRGPRGPMMGESRANVPPVSKANATLDMGSRPSRVPTPPKPAPEPRQQREQFSDRGPRGPMMGESRATVPSTEEKAPTTKSQTWERAHDALLVRGPWAHREAQDPYKRFISAFGDQYAAVTKSDDDALEAQRREHVSRGFSWHTADYLD